MVDLAEYDPVCETLVGTIASINHADQTVVILKTPCRKHNIDATVRILRQMHTNVSTLLIGGVHTLLRSGRPGM